MMSFQMFYDILENGFCYSVKVSFLIPFPRDC